MKLLKILTLLSVLNPISAIFKAISIYGLETQARSFVCSWVKPVEWYMEKLKDLGFNSLRLPFSYEYVYENNFNEMDRFILYAGYYNMPVVLDFHRVYATHQGPSPLENISIDDFVNCWLIVLNRYNSSDIVVGMNAFNEYTGTNSSFVNYYSKYLFDRVEERFPNRFQYYMTGTQWAGNLSGISLENEPYSDRVFYSVHKYFWSGTADEKDWNYSFLNVGLPTEKLFVGEWGFKSQNDNEVEWAIRFIKYLKKHNITNTAFWTLCHSHDTDGIFYDDCIEVDWKKLAILKDLWSNDKRYLRTCQKVIPLS